MAVINIDRSWRFRLARHEAESVQKTGWTDVDLPHDFSILQARDPNSPGGASNGFFRGGLGLYEKTLDVPEEWRGRRVLAEFEGVYMNAQVRINMNSVAYHPYGYTSFFCDLTPHLHYGQENTLSVSANNTAMPNSRWYSGSGIYRHVRLYVLPRLHIEPWGVTITTPEVGKDSSTVHVAVQVRLPGAPMAGASAREGGPKAPEGYTVRFVVTGQDGRRVASAGARPVGNAATAAGRPSDGSGDGPSNGANPAAETPAHATAAGALTIAPARLWSPEDPALYALRAELVRGDEVIDSATTRFGIRSISVDRRSGFMLNGVPMKLRGGCVHHDCGILGSAAYDRAEERKVELMKASGFNAVRCAHNPPSAAFLDACDRLGLLVIDEAFDCWRDGKNPNDYSMAFADHWLKDLESMIRRDRNHPSIIMWSTGNEIRERDGRSAGYAWSRRLADAVRGLDPTRPVTNAICALQGNLDESELAANLGSTLPEAEGTPDYWAELTADFAAPLDVVGYNYLLDRYERDAERFPDRVICGEETFPKDAFDYWEATKRLPHVIGDFVWTAIDYLGEAGIGHVWFNGETGFLGSYPWHSANCGDIDICGFKRPQSYYRDCVWGIAEAPFIAVHDPAHHGKAGDVSAWGWPDVHASWSWPGHEGTPTTVDVYSTDDEVELLFNGVSVGRAAAGHAARYIARFETTYRPGTLVAVAYSAGVETSRTVLHTAGPPSALRLTPDRAHLRSVFGDLSYITVEVVDADGNVCHACDASVTPAASGAGRLIALGTSDPKSEESFGGPSRRLFFGRAMAVVRASGEPGEINVTAVAEGLPASGVALRVG